MALKLEGWNLLFYVFDGLKAISRNAIDMIACFLLHFSSSLSLFLFRVVKIPHIRIVSSRMTFIAEGGSFVSKSTSFIELSKIYHENIIDLCDETLSTLWYFFAFVCRAKEMWGGDGYYHLWVNEEQCQESILGSALRMFKEIIIPMMISIEM